jgi:hypothetical protein
MLPLAPGSAAAVVQLPTGIDERRGRVPAAPRPLCLAPFSQDPMIGNYHTQIKVTVRYISTLQLPGVVHVGRFSSVFPNLWNERMRDNCRRSACVGIIQSRRREISRRSREFENLLCVRIRNLKFQCTKQIYICILRLVYVIIVKMWQLIHQAEILV